MTENPARGQAAESGRERVPVMPADIAKRLDAAGLSPVDVLAVVATALAEDLAGGQDVTTAATVDAATRGSADVVARLPGVVAGLPVAELVFWAVSADDPLECVTRAADGDRVVAGQTLLTVSGQIGAILTAERTALNLLGHLSGIATLTRRFADAVAGTGARIRDTRKTLPGLRALQKYAVRCGGGVNHRMSLSDAALIKDNHVAAAGSVRAAFAAVRAAAPDLPVEVECDSLAQVAEAIDAGADLILLDNFSIEQTEQAVALTAGRAKLEASGRIVLPSAAAAIAATGVDYLAVGVLTHSAEVLDIGLDLAGPD
jgi:nicotinate-nucleotide pyrophosphorylase (carboxylating)